jgi:site-specific DNA recombinase
VGSLRGNVEDSSRLSRSTESVLSIYRKLNFAGLQLISVSQGIDSRQDQAETLLTIHGLIDSSYVRELAKKTHRGCESAVLRSLHVGGSCFGYTTAPVGEPGTGSKRLVIDETQAKIVRRILEMSATGYSLKAIARKLNEERAASRDNWCPTGIRAMLKRELYKGELVWNRLKFEKVPETNKLQVDMPRSPRGAMRRPRTCPLLTVDEDIGCGSLGSARTRNDIQYVVV